MKREKMKKILITLLLLLLCYSIIGTYKYNDVNASCVFDSSEICTISENTFVYDPNIPEETKTRIIYNGGDNNYTELDRKWVTTYTFMDYAQEHARIDYVVAPREDMRFHADGSTFTLTSETIHYSESSYHTGMRIEHEIMTRANASFPVKVVSVEAEVQTKLNLEAILDVTMNNSTQERTVSTVTKVADCNGDDSCRINSYSIQTTKIVKEVTKYYTKGIWPWSDWKYVETFTPNYYFIYSTGAWVDDWETISEYNDYVNYVNSLPDIWNNDLGRWESHPLRAATNVNANLFDASVAWREKMKRLDSDGYTFVTDYSYQTKGSTSQTC